MDYSGGSSFAGSLDDVRIYNRALSQKEITRLYKLGEGTKINTTPTDKYTNGLVGYWTFDAGDMTDSIATDRSGQGNNGTLQNGVQKTIGRMGQALNFFPGGSDTNARVSMDDPVSGIFDFGSGDFSISFFMRNRGYTDQSSSANFVLSKKNNESWDASGYMFGYGSDHHLNFHVGNGVSSGSAYSTATINDNAWHMYTGIRSGGVLSLYVDGVLSATSTISGTVANSDPLTIGSDNVGGTGFSRNANADVDEVRMYNRALSADEVQGLYNLGTPIKINTTPTTLVDDGLVGYWTFDGKDMYGTTTAYDRSPSHATGTLVNGVKTAIGKHGQALQMSEEPNDGRKISLGSPSQLDNVTRRTITMWIKPNGNGASSQKLFDKSRWFLNYMTSGELTLTETFSSGIGWWMLNSSPVVVNQWTHIAVTYDKTAISNNPTFYVNGNVSSSTRLTSPAGTYVSEASDFAYLGGDVNTPGTTLFNGLIDDVRIYNRAISADEVQLLYNAGR